MLIYPLLCKSVAQSVSGSYLCSQKFSIGLSLSTMLLYYIAIVISIYMVHKDIALSLCKFYIAIVIISCYNIVK